MNTKIRYDLDSLELANGDFGYPITEKEVRKVNRMLELMENVRSRQMCPTEGDCVEFISRSGDYFGKAHIERITGKYADICLIPETVFCFDDRSGNGNTENRIRCMTVTPPVTGSAIIS